MPGAMEEPMRTAARARDKTEWNPSPNLLNELGEGQGREPRGQGLAAGVPAAAGGLAGLPQPAAAASRQSCTVAPGGGV